MSGKTCEHGIPSHIDCVLCEDKQRAEALQQAHRAGWEQAKAEALFIVQNYECNPDRDGDFADQLDEEIANIEYKGETNDN